MKYLFALMLLLSSSVSFAQDFMTFRLSCDKTRVTGIGEIKGKKYFIKGRIIGPRVYFKIPAEQRGILPFLAKFFRDPDLVCGENKIICRVVPQTCM